MKYNKLFISYLKEIHNDVKELVKNKSNYNFEEYKTKRLMIKIDVNRLKILREICYREKIDNSLSPKFFMSYFRSNISFKNVRSKYSFIRAFFIWI